MGCDVHFFVERQDGITGVWQRVEELRPNPDTQLEAEPPVLVRRPWYSGRDYWLFSILADVRNYHNETPIAHPRGLPDDVSDEVRQITEEWGIDGHSHSYLTLRELLDYDWYRPIPHRGWFKELARAKFYIDWKGEIPPWVKTYGPDRRAVVAMGDTEELVHPDPDNPGEWEYLEWTEPLIKQFPDFAATLLRMAHLAKGRLNLVRAVFFFDN